MDLYQQMGSLEISPSSFKKLKNRSQVSWKNALVSLEAFIDQQPGGFSGIYEVTDFIHEMGKEKDSPSTCLKPPGLSKLFKKCRIEEFSSVVPDCKNDSKIIDCRIFLGWGVSGKEDSHTGSFAHFSNFSNQFLLCLPCSLKSVPDWSEEITTVFWSLSRKIAIIWAALPPGIPP